MSCKHAEDVCQHCLEKVQTTTEDAPPSKRSPKTEKENSPPSKRSPKTEKEKFADGKTMTPQEKRINVLIDSSLLAVFGAAAFYNAKWFFKSYVKIFDSSLDTINSLLRTIGTRTRKE